MKLTKSPKVYTVILLNANQLLRTEIFIDDNVELWMQGLHWIVTDWGVPG